MLPNREGQRVPDTVFRTRENGEWVDRTSREVFDGRTVACLALPGAFTPTCSSMHLPRYDELAADFERCGVDEVVCLSVNDAFVMDAWKRELGIERVTLLPDGNGEFTEGMGMLVDKGDLGFGRRSWRYSMLVRDGVIEKMFIEPEKPGDPFDVSDADTMLHYIAPDEAPSVDVSLFARPGCPHCARARRLLRDASIDFEEIELGADISGRTLRAVTGATTVPQAFVNGKRIGGAHELEKWLQERG